MIHVGWSEIGCQLTYEVSSYVLDFVAVVAHKVADDKSEDFVRWGPLGNTQDLAQIYVIQQGLQLVLNQK